MHQLSIPWWKKSAVGVSSGGDEEGDNDDSYPPLLPISPSLLPLSSSTSSHAHDESPSLGLLNDDNERRPLRGGQSNGEGGRVRDRQGDDEGEDEDEDHDEDDDDEDFEVYGRGSGNHSRDSGDEDSDEGDEENSNDMIIDLTDNHADHQDQDMDMEQLRRRERRTFRSSRRPKNTTPSTGGSGGAGGGSRGASGGGNTSGGTSFGNSRIHNTMVGLLGMTGGDRDRDHDVMPMLVNEAGEPAEDKPSSSYTKNNHGDRTTSRGSSGGGGGRGGKAPLPATSSEEMQALHMFVSLSAFRAMATSMQCETLVYTLVPGPTPTYPHNSTHSPITTTAVEGKDGIMQTPSPSNSRSPSPVYTTPTNPADESTTLHPHPSHQQDLDFGKVNRNVLEELICLSVQETQCGGLAVVEAVEARWTALWEAYEALNRSPDSQDERGSLGGDGSLGGGGGGGGRDTSNTPPPVVDSLRARLVDATGGGEMDSFARHIGRNLGLGSGNPLLEAASAIGLFSPFGAPQLSSRSSAPTVDAATQAAAIAQMTDMGLPRDWCEVALRRCRYNVELAINMCFENGGDMSQIVAEDAMMQAAQVDISSLF